MYIHAYIDYVCVLAPLHINVLQWVSSAFLALLLAPASCFQGAARQLPPKAAQVLLEAMATRIGSPSSYSTAAEQLKLL